MVFAHRRRGTLSPRPAVSAGRARFWRLSTRERVGGRRQTDGCFASFSQSFVAHRRTAFGGALHRVGGVENVRRSSHRLPRRSVSLAPTVKRAAGEYHGPRPGSNVADVPWHPLPGVHDDGARKWYVIVPFSRAAGIVGQASLRPRSRRVTVPMVARPGAGRGSTATTSSSRPPRLCSPAARRSDIPDQGLAPHQRLPRPELLVHASTRAAASRSPRWCPGGTRRPCGRPPARRRGGGPADHLDARENSRSFCSPRRTSPKRGLARDREGPRRRTVGRAGGAPASPLPARSRAPRSALLGARARHRARPSRRRIPTAFARGSVVGRRCCAGGGTSHGPQTPRQFNARSPRAAAANGGRGDRNRCASRSKPMLPRPGAPLTSTPRGTVVFIASHHPGRIPGRAAPGAQRARIHFRRARATRRHTQAPWPPWRRTR